MKGAVRAKARQIQFQRFRLDEPFAGNVVDHDMREVRLARDWAQRGELRRGEAHEITLAWVRIGHDIEFGLVGRSRKRRFLAEQRGALMGLGHGAS